MTTVDRLKGVVHDGRATNVNKVTLIAACRDARQAVSTGEKTDYDEGLILMVEEGHNDLSMSMKDVWITRYRLTK